MGSGPLIEQLKFRSVGEKMLEWGPCPREAGPPRSRLSSPGERERNAVMAMRVGVNMLQFCLISNSLSYTILSIKWEVYFSKELCRLSLLCRCYDSACICTCVCIVVHGYTTLPLCRDTISVATIYPSQLFSMISTSYINSCPFDRAMVSLISGQGHFTCLQIYNWEWKKRINRDGLGLALSIRREKFWHFSGIQWLSWACTRTKFPASCQERWLILSRWLTWLLGSQVPTFHFSSRPSLTFANSNLFTILGPCLSLSSSGLIRNLVRKPFG